MLALVVDNNKATREVLVRLLQLAEYRVDQAADPAGALAAIDREHPDVVVLPWGPNAAPLIAQIRAREAAERSYILTLLDAQPAAEIPRVYTAGADDFCRRPVSREELVGRLDAPRRIRAWVRAPTLDWSNNLRFQTLRAWRELGSLVAEDLAQLVGPLDVAPVTTLGEAGHVATIPLTLAKEETEVRLTVAIELRFLPTFTELLLGDPKASEEMAADMLRELANTASGAVKRAAVAEQLIVTTGLPVSTKRGPTAANDNTCCWVATLHGGDAQIALIGEVLTKENRSVSASDLREGMVLSQDLRTPQGALVLPAGTRLTTTAVDRVVKLLGVRFKVEVACAA